MTTESDRISRLEGAYEHLATKADLHQMENRLIRWLLGGIAAAVGIATGLDRLPRRLTPPPGIVIPANAGIQKAPPPRPNLVHSAPPPNPPALTTPRPALVERTLRVDAANIMSDWTELPCASYCKGRAPSLDNSIPAFPRSSPARTQDQKDNRTDTLLSERAPNPRLQLHKGGRSEIHQDSAHSGL